MPIKEYKCPVCEKVTSTKKTDPTCCDIPMVEQIALPSTKFMEAVDKDGGKSQLKDQQKILLERARAHSRDVEMHDMIQNNPQQISYQNKWLKDDGTKRSAIDDK